MEKIIIVTEKRPLCNEDMDEINKHLSNGWSVKSVTPQSFKDSVSIIFVLEKNIDISNYFSNNCSSCAGRYQSNPLWDNHSDHIDLFENGTYISSICGMENGQWTLNENSVTIIPKNTSSRLICPINYTTDECTLYIDGRYFTKK